MFNMLQFGTPWSDGREGVTQCPIVPGDTFKYKFKVERVCVTCQQSETSLQLTLIKTHTHTQRSNNDLFSSLVVNLFFNLIIIHVLLMYQAGTYLYHAHYGMQRDAGLYGSIQVSLPDGVSEPFAYDYDRSIILDDCYHKSISEQAVGLSSIPFVWVGEPQVLLVPYVTNRISIILLVICLIQFLLLLSPSLFQFSVTFDSRKRKIRLLQCTLFSWSLQCIESRMLSLFNNSNPWKNLSTKGRQLDYFVISQFSNRGNLGEHYHISLIILCYLQYNTLRLSLQFKRLLKV